MSNQTQVRSSVISISKMYRVQTWLKKTKLSNYFKGARFKVKIARNIRINKRKWRIQKVFSHNQTNLAD